MLRKLKVVKLHSLNGYAGNNKKHHFVPIIAHILA